VGVAEASFGVGKGFCCGMLVLDICMLASILPKKIFTSDVEHDVPTSRHGFCVFCILPYFAHAFVYLRNPRLH